MSQYLDTCRNIMITMHYSKRTIQSYLPWIKRFIQHNDNTHPSSMHSDEVEKFLTHLAVAEHVSKSAQNQAFAALCWLYRHIEKNPLTNVNATRSQRPEKLPFALTQTEIQKLFTELSGVNHFLALLMYGSGLRLQETYRLRIKDLDQQRSLLYIWNGKGTKHRLVPCLSAILPLWHVQTEAVKRFHQQDLTKGYGKIWMPHRLAEKYDATSLDWQWLFPAKQLSKDEHGTIRRHHIHEDSIRKAIQRAGTRAGISRRVNPHTLRHTYATHFLERSVYDQHAGLDSTLALLQQYLGHEDIKTTMKYIHLMSGPSAVHPLEGVLS